MTTKARVLDFRDHRRELGQNRYVYAVVSRRAQGLSIGLNLNPGRDCSFLCRYCQVERSAPPQAVPVLLDRLGSELEALLGLVGSGKLWQHPPFDTVRDELRRVADIAFAGDGEPSTSPQLAAAVAMVGLARARHRLEGVPLRLLSNGSGFHTPTGRLALARFHALGGELWFKLDAGTPQAYQRINCSTVPLERILDNLMLASRQRPVVVQSLFSELHGQAPTAAEIHAWVQRLLQVVQSGGRVRETERDRGGRRCARVLSGPVVRGRHSGALRPDVRVLPSTDHHRSGLYSDDGAGSKPQPGNRHDLDSAGRRRGLLRDKAGEDCPEPAVPDRSDFSGHPAP